jgi:hypothetical protein
MVAVEVQRDSHAEAARLSMAAQRPATRERWRKVGAERGDSTAANAKSDLFPILAICAIGLLTTIDVMLRWPDLGALIASYNQF